MRYGVLNGDWVTITDNPKDPPIVDTSPPDFIAVGNTAVAHYELRSGTLVKVWEIRPITEEEQNFLEEQEEQTNVGQKD